MIFVRTLLAASLVAMTLAFAGAAIASEKPLTVIELYTSQGCSSCPPADAYLGELAEPAESLLGEIARRDDVVALAFHVDYWNYLGWEDPYSDAAYSQRQRDYARFFDARNVYTPQMVIQGTHQAVGSNRSAVQRAMNDAASLPHVNMELARRDGELLLALPAVQGIDNARVLMVMYDNEHITAVRRGENRGKKMRNRNVVRNLSHVATWRGEAMTVPLSYVGLKGDKGAVLLQSTESGAILGAVLFDIN